jgi:hypothetical protein
MKIAGMVLVLVIFKDINISTAKNSDFGRAFFITYGLF